MSVPVSETGKHFSDEKRTLATGVVTAAASIGYFIAPLFTQYSLLEFGWQGTLRIFFILFYLAFIASLFLFPVEKRQLI